jgi:hypothetical protein
MKPFIKIAKIAAALVFLLISFTAFAALATEAGAGTGDLAAWVQAVGSIVAIIASARIATEQINKQRAADRARNAKEDHRSGTFAAEVISDAIQLVQSLEVIQRRAGLTFDYKFHDREHFSAMRVLLQTAAAGRPYVELIRPIIETHALLVAVESASIQLESQRDYVRNSRFDLHWTDINKRISIINTSLSAALATANIELREAEQAVEHGGWMVP